MGTLSDTSTPTIPAMASKINWLGIITAVIAGGAYFTQQINAKAAIGGALIGALTVILRTFFTSSQVDGVFTTPKA